MTEFKPEVAEAVAEVQAQFAGKRVEVDPDDAGGAYVVIHGIDPGPAYTERDSWLGFHISPLYPDADTYPLYLRGDLIRADGAAHQAPITPTTWRDRQALQVSRRVKGTRDPQIDTPALKAAGVIAWLVGQ